MKCKACKESTKFGKEYCLNHIKSMPYAAKIVEMLPYSEEQDILTILNDRSVSMKQLRRELRPTAEQMLKDGKIKEKQFKTKRGKIVRMLRVER